MTTTRTSWTEPRKIGFDRNVIPPLQAGHDNYMNNLYMVLLKKKMCKWPPIASEKKAKLWSSSLKPLSAPLNARWAMNKKIEFKIKNTHWLETSSPYVPGCHSPGEAPVAEWVQRLPAKVKRAERAKELKGTFLTSVEFMKGEKKKLPTWILHSTGPLIVDLNL